MISKYFIKTRNILCGLNLIRYYVFCQILFIKLKKRQNLLEKPRLTMAGR